MYQSKLAKPEVKPHFYWSKLCKGWFYDADDYETILQDEQRNDFCMHLDRTYKPLRSGK